VVEFGIDGKVISIEEKPAKPKSTYAVPGIYFYDERASKLARELSPAERGELEITALNNLYLEMGELRAEILSRARPGSTLEPTNRSTKPVVSSARYKVARDCASVTSSRSAATRLDLERGDFNRPRRSSRSRRRC